jgi:DNA-binding NarL/FixJ family response regulator
MELVAQALRGIKWFHRQLLLGHGFGASEKPITVAERRIIKGLLSGATEKVIAEEANLTCGTVHQYATRIYRKFGVNGRAEFMALWLGGVG